MIDTTQGMAQPERARFLKERFLSRRPSICLEGALAKTRAFRKTEGEALIVRRAKGFRRHCETKTIVIDPRELIVGHPGCRSRSAVICPELSNTWLCREFDRMPVRDQDPYDVTEEQKRLYREEIYPYWVGKTLRERWNGQAPKDLLELIAVGGVIDNDIKIECAPGETTPEFPDHLLPKGFKGIQDEAQALLDAVDLTVPANYEKRDFWQAAVIVNEGLRILCRRHAEAAEALAARESDPIRKAELLNIASDCAFLADNPPATFRQALQQIHFLFMGLYMESNAGGYSPGRMDQYLYPYYLRDRAEGILDDATALELIECFWIKSNDAVWYWDEAGIKHYAGYCSFQNVCLGGLDRETGQDGVNELTYLMLKATIDLQMVQPSVSVRLSKKNPEDYFLKIAELVRTDSGFPAIYNEEVGLKMLMKKGVPLEKAWDWSCIGCVEPLMPGKTSQWSSAGHYNLAAAVEFALTNGVHRKSGKRIGLETGNPEAFATYEVFKAAVYAQLDRLIRQFSISQNLIERLQQQFFPNPLISMSILDCVENGKDLMHGGARYNVGPGMNGNGVADFADSLIAVKKLVYDEKRLPMHTLLEALAADFQGYEAVERMLAEDAPKWGNDDPDVDAVVMELCDFIIKIHAELKGILGNPKMPALYPVSSNVPQGLSIGALPSGRRAGKPLADGCSPSQGCDRFGPTAILRSLDKMPHACLDGGTLLNLWLTPAVVQGEEGGHRLSAFLKAFLDMDIFHIQFNVVGQDILRCAQERPEEYRSLLVRVAGYSAYFVELSREVQDDILSRTVNTL